nr:TetR/AcrR family transcriptional regulator [Acinetobacter sp. Marseille-Q1620]
MTKKISTFDKICEVATAHFAVHGYDASSLNIIAETVGIRKASLYSHFKSKDELFHTVFFNALDKVSAFMESCFIASDVENIIGEVYCKALLKEFEQSEYLRFFLKTVFIPPTFIQPEVNQAYPDYLKKIGKYIEAKIKKLPLSLTTDEITEFAEAYLGIIDSLHIELIYSDHISFERKRIAMLNVFNKAIHCKQA